ncbi:MAG: hypothetical protein ACYDIB_03850 [Desulfobulbia bacterium]
MKNTKGTVGLLVAILIMGTSMNAFGFLGFGGSEKWKEEVQLSDGRVIVVERETLREGGGGEWASNRSGTKPKEHRIRFAHPDGSGKMIEWRSAKKSPATWPEVPLILDLESGQLLVFASVGTRARCEKYSKYIYRNGAWSEEALPETFEKRTTNLYLGLGVDMPKFVDLNTKHKENKSKSYSRSLRQVGPTREVCGD